MKQILIQESDFQEARKQIKKNKSKEIIFSGKTDDLNRKVLEKENIDILLLNLKSRKDRMKQRDSGFNHILAKLAKKKYIIIGINLDEILEEKSKKEKSEILARIRQNIKLCNKNKLKMKFISPSGKSKKDPHDLKSLGLVLGMPTWMVKFN
ncbi:MAG: RNase P subunit p30 family protein [Candidatus Pacearchaeota archaeon]